MPGYHGTAATTLQNKNTPHNNDRAPLIPLLLSAYSLPGVGGRDSNYRDLAIITPLKNIMPDDDDIIIDTDTILEDFVSFDMDAIAFGISKPTPICKPCGTSNDAIVDPAPEDTGGTIVVPVSYSTVAMKALATNLNASAFKSSNPSNFPYFFVSKHILEAASLADLSKIVDETKFKETQKYTKGKRNSVTKGLHFV